MSSLREQAKQILIQLSKKQWDAGRAGTVGDLENDVDQAVDALIQAVEADRKVNND